MNYITKKLDDGKIKIQARNNNRDLYYCLLTKGEAKELMTQLYRALNEEEQIMEDAVNATVDFPIPRYDFPNIYPNYKELKEYCIRHGIKDNDKVKITIVKENKL